MYTKDLFDAWAERELKHYDLPNRKFIKKGYKHFDPKIFFPDYIEDYRKKFSDFSSVVSWQYLPLIKVISKTPRFRYNEIIEEMEFDYKARPLAYSGHQDALLYSFAAFYLNENYEKYIQQEKIAECVYAYRSTDGKNNIDFAKEVFDFIKNKGPCVAIALDIKGFFDHLNHKLLLANWKKVIGGRLTEDQMQIFHSVTKYNYVYRTTALNHLKLNLRKFGGKIDNFCSPEEFRNIIRGENLIQSNPDDFGIPQGLPISAVLSNIYMIDFDKAILEFLGNLNAMYRRYCDDIIIVCSYEDYEKVKAFCYSEIKKIKLEIQPKKEEIICFRKTPGGKLKSFDGKVSGTVMKKLQYLGFEFDGENVYIRSSSLARYYRRMKDSIELAVIRSYGSNSRGDRIFMKDLLTRFTHLGKKNFIRYALQAADKFNSITIRKQVADHMSIFENTLKEKVRKVEKELRKKGKFKKSKLIQRPELVSWENVKGQYVETHLSKSLIQPARRVNALNRIENILMKNYPKLLITPKKITNYKEKDFLELIRKNKASGKISGADESVVNGLFEILVTK